MRCCVSVSFLKIYVATDLNNEDQNQNCRPELLKSFSYKQSILKTAHWVRLEAAVEVAS